MFGSSSVRYGSFSIRANFKSIISGVSSDRIPVRSVRVIRVGSLLPGLTLIKDYVLDYDKTIMIKFKAYPN